MLKAVLFDLDGTIINTNELILDSFRYILNQQNNYNVTDEEILTFFGEPLFQTMYKFSHDAERLVKSYREYNITKHDELTKEFPEVKELLDELQSRGLRLGIVTSKMKDTALRGLRLFDLEKYFEVVVAYDDTSEHKPKAAPVLKGLELMSLKPEEAFYVGDSPYDVLSARAAGVLPIAVKYSTLSLEKLLEVKPYAVIDSPLGLLKLLESNFN